MAIPFSELSEINPSSIIELFELELEVGKHIATGNPQNLPTTYRFHAGANLNSFGEVVFQSNSYQRVAVKIDGFERRSTGVLPRPTITFSNLGGINRDPTTSQVITMSDFLATVNDVTPHNVLIDAKITRSATDFHLIKNAPIPAGGSLELIDGGSKVVMLNGDVLKAQASLTGSIDAIVSFIDTISE